MSQSVLIVAGEASGDEHAAALVRSALALDPDHLLGFAAFFASLGAEVIAAVSPVRAESLG